ncbi:uncharacterized protein LOC127854829 [Dreissena polymorpha]|uniref:Secreted protein n=1 Tax=Dreissena polymorpha TaxID=45954 RepID=A0A9D4CBN6_DREPO|nr:uncharacterized protein LOC127854829 [Dreissena polymorpha]KAH3720509.1 hypothetical protein DPMN_063408 [Dreissena polymorpha]
MYHKRSAIRIPMTVILMVISKTCRVVTAIDCYVCTSDEDNCGTNVNEEQLILEQKLGRVRMQVMRQRVQIDRHSLEHGDPKLRSGFIEHVQGHPRLRTLHVHHDVL